MFNVACTAGPVTSERARAHACVCARVLKGGPITSIDFAYIFIHNNGIVAGRPDKDPDTRRVCVCVGCPGRSRRNYVCSDRFYLCASICILPNRRMYYNNVLISARED